ncbi:MAG: cupin domain-containing protein [Burkholderiaceae bacterium]|nr:cupin domain-containing protein [Burkholderiaceae bacterium]MCD8564514.1 cupin domain-containing protein [Burkholderiaceae bacterium]
MQVNAEFDKRVVVDTSSAPWVGSPVSDVMRKMLDRMGGEVARATSIVRYQPGSCFPSHVHGGGEEIFVLEGVFSDEFGDYPAGTYLRNPPGSSHQPRSERGCTLFVKLWQFMPGDQQTVRIDTRQAQWYEGMVPGLFVMPLHEHDGVNTALVRWAPNTQFNRHVHPGGEEILVLEGTFYDEHGTYEAGSWLRSPCYSEHRPFTKAEGSLIYVKTGHIGAPCLELPGA